jgi:NAD(P)-dependent dehydrogenase (short-subunit alcohol dehydrogenase family)
MGTEKPLIALVTGANRGLGQAWCRQLALMGYTVILTARSLDKAQEAVSAILADHPELPLVAKALDVTDEDSIKALADEVKQEYGYLDLLVNNAGINSKSSNNELTFLKNFRLSYLDPKPILEMIHINSLAPIMVAKHLVGLLRRGRQPKIVNMSSWLGAISQKTSGGNYSYATSKAALNMMTRALAFDVVKEGVVVVAVNPGWVQTRMGGFSASLTPEQSVQRLIDHVLVKLTIEDAGKFFDWDGTEHPW